MQSTPTKNSSYLKIIWNDGEESKFLLRKLAGAIRDPSIQIRVRWDETTVVMWDNRCVQHAGTDDFLPAHRRMERTTVAGDRPF